MASWHIHIIALLETQERGQLAMHAITFNNHPNLVNNAYRFPEYPADNRTKQISTQRNRHVSSRLLAVIILCFQLEDFQPVLTKTNDPTNEFQQNAHESE